MQPVAARSLSRGTGRSGPGWRLFHIRFLQSPALPGRPRQVRGMQASDPRIKDLLFTKLVILFYQYMGGRVDGNAETKSACLVKA